MNTLSFVFNIFEKKPTKPKGLFDQLPRTKSGVLLTTPNQTPKGFPKTESKKLTENSSTTPLHLLHSKKSERG